MGRLEGKANRHQLLLETMNQGVQENACDGTITYSNPAHHEILGYPDGELVGRKIWELQPSEEERQGLRRYLDTLVRSQPAPEPYLTRSLRKDGTPVDLQVDWNYERDQDGELAGFISVITDITQRKAAEDDLRRRTEGLAALLEASRGLAETLDLAKVLQAVADGVTRLTGLDTAAVYLLKGEDLHLGATTPPLPPGFPEELCVAAVVDHPHIRQAIESGTPVYVDDFRRAELSTAEREAAEQRSLRTVLFVPLIVETRPLGAFIVGSTEQPCALSDVEVDLSITLANLAALVVRNSQLFEEGQQHSLALEHSLARYRQSEAEREVSERRYRTLFEHSTHGIVITDRDGCCLDVNPRMCQLFEYTRDEFVGLCASDFVEAADVPKVEAGLRRIEEGAEYFRVWSLRRKGGETFEAEVSATALPDGHVLGMIRDVTAQRQAEEKSASLEAQLQTAQRMEAVGRLAGGIAHDFNNMLSVIQGHAELGLTRVQDNAELRGDLEQVLSAAQRSANLTRQLLGFARKQVATPVVLDINATIDEMLQMLGRMIGEDIHLVWAPGENVGAVRMDPSQVDQILANLCVNARDAIAGTGRVAIETGNAEFDERYCEEHPGFRPGYYVTIAVSDDGAGIDKEVLPDIFDPFFSTKEELGTGLGLSTVYGIVKQNRGFINVYSEPGQGTTFRVYLPRQQEAVAVPVVGPRVPVSEGGGETILLVEDEEMILELGTAMLETLGYRVVAANRPREALQIARDHTDPIDLVVTDVVMPEMNGRELAEQLQVLFPRVRVLYMSGYTANVITHRGVLDEGVVLLEKPFSVAQLAAKVREALAQGVARPS